MKTTLTVKQILTSNRTNAVYNVILSVKTGRLETDISIFLDVINGKMIGPELKTYGFEVSGNMIHGATKHFKACEVAAGALDAVNFTDDQRTVTDLITAIVNS